MVIYAESLPGRCVHVNSTSKDAGRCAQLSGDTAESQDPLRLGPNHRMESLVPVSPTCMNVSGPCSSRMDQSSAGIVAIGEVDQAVESTSQCSRVKLALDPENPWFHRTRKVHPAESVIGPSRKRIKEAVPASDAFNCHRSPSRIHCSTVPCSTHSDCPRAFPVHTPRATNTPNRILCNSVFQRTSVKT